MNGWQEPDERERPSGYSGDWRGARPTFDDPMSWSFPILRVAGITVRLHLLFVVFIVAALSRAASDGGQSPLNLLPALIGLGALFAIVLLHEFGHAIACRVKGGTADEILLWPLGGLATCTPPDRPSAHFWTAVGGPLVNVAFIAVLTPWIGVTTGEWWGRAIPNPFGLATLVQRAEVGDWLQLTVLLTNYVAWTLLLFNLLPMFPLDGGRIVQAVLWKRMGYARSMRIACRSGLVGAVLLGMVALWNNETMLLVIAIFGGFTCFVTAKQIERERDFLGFDPDPAELLAMEEEFGDGASDASGGRGATGTAPGKQSRAAASDAARKADEARRADEARSREAELDRILAKIASQGIDSLTRTERDTLQRATDEKRDR